MQVYYVLTENPDPYPPDITNYLNSIASAVGAESTWRESSELIYENFAVAGERLTLIVLVDDNLVV